MNSFHETSGIFIVQIITVHKSVHLLSAIKVWANAIKVWANAIKVWANASKMTD